MILSNANMQWLAYILIFQAMFSSYSCFNCSDPQVKELKKEDVLQVHLIPHSHLDPGWQTTYERYYEGDQTTMAYACVKCTLDSVMKALGENPKRKFAYSEISFLKTWWDEQSDEMKSKVKKYVKDGQLYFVNGGWVVNDEAVSHYASILEQYTIGMDFIRKHFGNKVRPHLAWQIDPFGHSHGFASLITKFAFDGMVLNRINIREKKNRIKSQELDMIWKLDKDSKDVMFSTILYNHYSMPKKFCFDIRCQEMMGWHMQDYRNKPNTTKMSAMEDFVQLVCKRAEAQKTNHLMLLMGDDFHYREAGRIFDNMDIIINETKKMHNVNVFYSSPSSYFAALNKGNQLWPVKDGGDFFPYYDFESVVWTGFYTSRPFLKRILRYSEGLLQGCKQLYALVTSTQKVSDTPRKLQEAISLLQHHDAVTGTCRDEVAADYIRRLVEGASACMSMLGYILLPQSNAEYSKVCSPVDIGFYQCKPDALGARTYLTIYNSLSWPVKKFVAIPVPNKKIRIDDDKGKSIPQQFTNSFSNQSSNYLYAELTIPSLGYKRVVLTDEDKLKAKEEQKSKFSCRIVSNDNEKLVISNGKIDLTFSKIRKSLEKITNNMEGNSISLKQKYYGYSDRGGAYIFDPSGEATDMSVQRNIDLDVKTKGSLLIEVSQRFSPSITQVIRLFKDADSFEIEYEILPNVVSEAGLFGSASIITRFDTDLENDKIFFTDANGREKMRRNSSSYMTTKNYYPVPTHISIRDLRKEKELVLLPDRSHGGSSLENGQIELMLFRTLQSDDDKGLGEGQEEKETLSRTPYKGKGKIRVLFGSINFTKLRSRLMAEEVLKEPILVYHNVKGNQAKLQTTDEYSLLGADLRGTVQLLTVERRKDDILIRLEHIYERTTIGQSIDVPLKNIFHGVVVKSAEELIITGDAGKDDIKPLSWKLGTDTNSNRRKKRTISGSNLIVTMKPFEIRTFLLKVERTSKGALNSIGL